MSIGNDDRERIYRRFIELLTTGQMDALHEMINLERWQEICVGVSGGWVDWDGAVYSFGTNIYSALPDISLEFSEILVSGEAVMARAIAKGTHTGAPLLGVPASGAAVSFELADFVRIDDDGLVYWRWMLPDMFTAMRQVGGSSWAPTRMDGQPEGQPEHVG